ncbi:hypothetical protein D3C75_1063540 [compost metagenome]
MTYFIKTPLNKYRPVKMQITPLLPKLPINNPTTAGPTKVLNPAPRFRIDMAAPLFSGASVGIMAERGTKAARQAPNSPAATTVSR